MAIDCSAIIQDLEDAISGRASDAVLERSIDGTTLKYASLDQLLSWLDMFKARQAAEEAGEDFLLPGSMLLTFNDWR